MSLHYLYLYLVYIRKPFNPNIIANLLRHSSVSLVSSNLSSIFPLITNQVAMPMHLRKVFRFKIYFLLIYWKIITEQQNNSRNSMENVNNPIKIPITKTNRIIRVYRLFIPQFIGTYVIYVNADVFVICTWIMTLKCSAYQASKHIL